MYHVIYGKIMGDSRSARAGFDGFCAVGCVVVEIHALMLSILKIYISFIIVLFTPQVLESKGSVFRWIMFIIRNGDYPRQAVDISTWKVSSKYEISHYMMKTLERHLRPPTAHLRCTCPRFGQSLWCSVAFSPVVIFFKKPVSAMIRLRRIIETLLAAYSSLKCFHAQINYWNLK